MPLDVPLDLRAARVLIRSERRGEERRIPDAVCDARSIRLGRSLIVNVALRSRMGSATASGDIAPNRGERHERLDWVDPAIRSGE